MKMRMRNITLVGIILLVLTFTIGMAGATDQNTTGNETPTVTVTGNITATLTATPTPTVTVTGNITATLTATPTPTAGTTDDDGADDNLIGPGNALYGLKIAFENIGETFTFNASEKLGLQVSHARHRINEARAALRRNDTEAANRALDEYMTKLNQTNDTISKLSDKDTGVINAQKMIIKHQLILENLSISHPNNAGLQRAYNNSRNLEIKFASKTGQKLDLDITRGNQPALKDGDTEISVKEERSKSGAKTDAEKSIGKRNQESKNR